MPTIGYGNTYYPNGVKVKMTDKPITKGTAHSYLIAVISQFEDKVNKRLTVSVSQNQFDALVSHYLIQGERYIGLLILVRFKKQLNG